MASEDGYADHLLDQLRPIGPVQAARFFGGVALKLEGRQFAMLMDGRLYFAVNAATRVRYEEHGSRPFSYATRKGRVDVGRYFEVPAEVQEDGGALCAWAREALIARGS